MNYILLFIGFLLLIKGADIFVEGSSNIAKFFKIPTIIIGLTLVAFGTSAPEAAVSITAAINKSSDLSVSNIIGSNIFNLFVVLGITSLFKEVVTEKEVIKKDYSLSLFSSILLLVLIVINYFIKGSFILSRIGGGILLLVLIFYLINLVKSVDSSKKVVEERKFSIKDVIFIIVGLVGVVLGGNLTVNAATEIARTFGMSERFIGLTIVAMGTSLPELCTSLVALLKGENDIAVGNVIGSNIFNILFILGSASLVNPMLINVESIIDLSFLIIASILLLVFGFNDLKLKKKEGVGMLLFYVVYFVYIFMR